MADTLALHAEYGSPASDEGPYIHVGYKRELHIKDLSIPMVEHQRHPLTDLLQHKLTEMPSTTAFVYPPLDGSLVLNEMVDFNARHNPDLPFYVFPQEEPKSGSVIITHLEFARACHRVAHAVRPNREGVDGQIVAILATTDNVLYQTLTMGIMIAGFIPFPINSRNSAPAIMDMLRKTSCHRILATQHALSSLLDDVRAELIASASIGQQFELQIQDVPHLAQVFPHLGNESVEDSFEYFPKGNMRSAKQDVALYLHSSGSTGFPKAISITHLQVHQWVHISSATYHLSRPHIRVGAMSLPPFHPFGLYIQLLLPIATLRSVGLYAPTSLHNPTATPVIPNSDNILDCVIKTSCNALMVVPSFIEQLSSSAKAVEVLKTFVYLAFGGAPLSEPVGNALVAAGVTICNIYGGTEFGIVNAFDTDKENMDLWAWYHFDENIHIRWADQGNGMYECQILASEGRMPSVFNLPDVKGYATSDLFIKHPTREGWYKCVGRADDVIVLALGEKTVPAPMEGVISSHPMVAGAVMFGRGREYVGVLVEPRPEYKVDVTDKQQVADFRNKIWDSVEEANAEAPAFSRIFKEMILITQPEKPLPRVPKGSVMKKAAIQLYDQEISKLYSTVDSSITAGSDVPPPSSWTIDDLHSWLIAHASAVHSDKSVHPTDDLFDQGFDSLKATFLRNRILGTLKSSSDPAHLNAAAKIHPNIIFMHPTVTKLARALASVIGHPEEESADNSVDEKREIEDMIEKYSVGLSSSTLRSDIQMNGSATGKAIVLLTGTTGGLGSYLLASLLDNSAVEKVYAFNRPSKAESSGIQRQVAAFLDRGLNVDLLSSKALLYIEGDAAQDNLGLEQRVYDEILSSTTIIIHNAWRLDFNLSLSSFEPNVRGTRNLIDLALRSPHATTMRFLFTSSIGSTLGWDRTKGPFPEEVQFDASVAVGGGYGAGKYVCERLLERSGLQATSFRIGQISGGLPNGAWATTDWFPILVKSSLSIGALPEAQGVISWLPFDAVAGTILDVAFSKEHPPLACNVVHPHPVPWTAVMRPVAEYLYTYGISSTVLPIIPFADWIARVEERARTATEKDFREVPAVKLLDFMRNFATGEVALAAAGVDVRTAEAGALTDLSTARAVQISETMRELQEHTLGAEDAARWVKYWISVDMFA